MKNIELYPLAILVVYFLHRTCTLFSYGCQIWRTTSSCLSYLCEVIDSSLISPNIIKLVDVND